jgi:hypothetical protein
MVVIALGCLFVGLGSAASASTPMWIPLPGDVDVAPNDSSDTMVLSTNLDLIAGESRRVSDRLGATLSTSEGAEVGNRIVCLDPSGMPAAQTSSGANDRGSGVGELGLMESLLLTAPVTGTYTCQILARTSDGSRTNFVMTAVRGGPPSTMTGTWLRISSADEAGSHAWSNQECNSPGTFATCVYLGGFDTPSEAHVFTDQDMWTAAADTTEVDVVGTFQITSCPYGTASCVSRHWGFFPDWSVAQFQSALEFNQLNPDGSVCRANQSADDRSPSADNGPDRQRVYHLPNSVHHLPISYHLTALVAANCNGSRQFALDLHVGWMDGNPIKLDNGGFNVIQSVRGATTTPVPNVVGNSEAQAASAVRARALQPVTVSRAMNPAPLGTVFAQNSPGGTVEPVGSEVDLTVSLGQATVPGVLGMNESSAIHAITAAGLAVGQVSTINTCLDPSLVQLQNPRGGTQVVPGTSVSITIATCSSRGSDGPPLHPK